MKIEEIVEKIKAYNPKIDLGKINDAYRLAVEAHSKQSRLSGEPYLNHILYVADILANLKMDESTIAAGLLHDTLEDSVLTLEDLKAKMGEEIAALVDGVTKLAFKIRPEKEIRQADNFRKILLAMSKDLRVIIIKLADRLHNMRTLQYLPEEKRRENAQETLDIFAPLAHRLGMGSIRWELEDLSMKYLYPEDYKEMSEKIAIKRAEREKIVIEMKELLGEKLKEQGIKAEVFGRAKHFYSIFQKMKRQNKSFDEIFDIIAVRVITNSIEECYTTLGIIHSLWKPIPGQFNDYIAMPKSNMYQSLHTGVIGPKGLPLEIQIRTKDMHENSEFGIAAHWYYKEGGKRDKNIENKITWIRQLLEWLTDVKDSKEFMESLKMDLFSDEVFVFTPKGDVIELPLGATPIDFAYMVHSNLGDHYLGAKVNNKMVNLKYILKTGDIVEVIVAKNSHPNPDWLETVKTSKARSKIRQFVKEKDEVKK